MNNTSIIVILLAIVVAIGGGAYLFMQNGLMPAPITETPSDGSSAAGTVPEGTTGDWTDTPEIEINAEADASVSANTIHYTDDGFSPSTITVKKGTTLTFINQSNRDMWVASDQHPSHTSYDGTSRSEHCVASVTTAFDQCAKGNVYGFTFDKTGTWKYHDHANAQFHGTVVVID